MVGLTQLSGSDVLFMVFLPQLVFSCNHETYNSTLATTLKEIVLMQQTSICWWQEAPMQIELTFRSHEDVSGRLDSRLEWTNFAACLPVALQQL